MSRYWTVQATVNYKRGEWTGTMQVATFVLDGWVQGIQSQDQAEWVARSIVDPLGLASAVHVSVVQRDPDCECGVRS